MKVIEVPAQIYPRKAYVIDEHEQEYLNFTSGIEVLPSAYYENDNGGKFYYVRTHQDGTPGWKGGGYECVDEGGARRAFFLDSLIVHPRYFEILEELFEYTKENLTTKKMAMRIINFKNK